MQRKGRPGPWVATLLLGTLVACGGDPDPQRAAPTSVESTASTGSTTPPTDASTTVSAAVRSDTTTLVETTVATSPADAASAVEAFAGSEWFLGAVPATPIAADPDLPPIRFGMINQEDTPLGSYPEVRAAAEAAVAWIDSELGGVGGRPVEVITCVASFDPDRSRACAHDLLDAGVVAFVGGVDVTSEGSRCSAGSRAAQSSCANATRPRSRQTHRAALYDHLVERTGTAS